MDINVKKIRNSERVERFACLVNEVCGGDDQATEVRILQVEQGMRRLQGLEIVVSDQCRIRLVKKADDDRKVITDNENGRVIRKSVNANHPSAFDCLRDYLGLYNSEQLEAEDILRKYPSIRISHSTSASENAWVEAIVRMILFELRRGMNISTAPVREATLLDSDSLSPSAVMMT